MSAAGDLARDALGTGDVREGGGLRRLRRGIVLGVRALAMAFAALALVWGTGGNEALAAAALGAFLGVLTGAALARSSVRLPVALAVLAALAALGLGGAWLLTATEAAPRALGPAATLKIASALRFGIALFAGASILRALAARIRAALVLELAAVAGAVTAVFASHRDGVIARPLWLSDWAWAAGYDPSEILLVVGASSVFVLAVLLLFETESGRAVSSLLALGLVAAAVTFSVKVSGVQPPKPQLDLGPVNSASGDPPKPPPPDAGAAGQGEGDDAKGQQPPGGGSGSGEGEGPSSNSPAPMAVVLLESDYHPPSQAYYFREDALSQWNGARLVSAGRGDLDRDIPSGFPATREEVSLPPAPEGRTHVAATVALLTPHNKPFTLEGAVRLEPAPNPNAARFVRAYRFEALAQKTPYKELFGRSSGEPGWPESVRSHYIQSPEDPRYRKLALEIASRLPVEKQADPFALAVAVKLYLDKEAIYSSKDRHQGVADPTADFLFGTRRGYCVHFAHAAALLWRSLGVPARIGVGYRTEEDSRRGGSAIVVRGSDAHAWPELYLEGIGWVVLDIAPERNIDPPGQPVDDELQKLLGEMARGNGPDPARPKRRASLVPRSLGRDISLAALVGLAAALVLLYGVKLWRRLRPAFASGKTLARVGYRYALDRLAEVGLAREPGETREDFARRAAELTPSFERLTSLHVAARLRSPELPPERRLELSRQAWREAMAAFKKELASSVRPAKRAAGALHPASFLRAR